MKARWFNNDVCKNEEKLLERLDQAILDVINNPKKTQKTACIGTLLWQTLYVLIIIKKMPHDEFDGLRLINLDKKYQELTIKCGWLRDNSQVFRFPFWEMRNT